MFRKSDILALHATSLTSREGKFHPAIRDSNGQVWAWYNIACTTEDEATDRAARSLETVMDAAWDVCGEWNVQEA